MWNIDLTLVDVARVSRDAYAEAFHRVTGRPLVALPQTAGRTDSEIFFESLALNDAAPGGPRTGPIPTSQDLLARYNAALAAAFGARSELLPAQGRVLPGAREALAAVAGLPGVIQSVLTGTIRPNAVTSCGPSAWRGSWTPTSAASAPMSTPRAPRSSARSTERREVRRASSPARRRLPRRLGQGRGGRQGRRRRCIGVASGRSTSGELRDAGADPVLDDLSDTGSAVTAVNRLTSAVSAG